MNDNDIVKALECCTMPGGCDPNCPGKKIDCEIEVIAIDLIRRQKADIERLIDLASELTEDNEAWLADNHDLRVELKTAKSDAIREFAERLKATPYRFREEQTIYFDKPPITKMVLFVDDNDIDNLVKEMTAQ
mgnify:CR=1 FL=1